MYPTSILVTSCLVLGHCSIRLILAVSLHLTYILFVSYLYLTYILFVSSLHLSLILLQCCTIPMTVFCLHLTSVLFVSSLYLSLISPYLPLILPNFCLTCILNIVKHLRSKYQTAKSGVFPPLRGVTKVLNQCRRKEEIRLFVEEFGE